MKTTEQMLEDIKKDKDMLRIYKAILLLEQCETNTVLPQMYLEEIIMSKLGYYIDFEAHEIKKVGLK